MVVFFPYPKSLPQGSLSKRGKGRQAAVPGQLEPAKNDSGDSDRKIFMYNLEVKQSEKRLADRLYLLQVSKSITR